MVRAANRFPAAIPRNGQMWNKCRVHSNCQNQIRTFPTETKYANFSCDFPFEILIKFIQFTTDLCSMLIIIIIISEYSSVYGTRILISDLSNKSERSAFSGERREMCVHA